MTVTQMIRQLEAIKDNYGNIRISVNKPGLIDGNGTFQICDVVDVKREWVPTVDGDGFSETNKDGSERGTWRAVLS